MDNAGSPDVAQYVTWAGSTLVGLGLAIRWIVQWLSGNNAKRISQLEHRVADLTAKTLILGEALMRVTAEHGLLVTSDSEALAQARAALKRAFPISPELPAELAELVSKLDRE